MTRHRAGARRQQHHGSMMVHRQRFLDTSAFDESFVSYNDIELCVRLLRLRFHHVYTPYAALLRHESEPAARRANPKKGSTCARSSGSSGTIRSATEDRRTSRWCFRPAGAPGDRQRTNAAAAWMGSGARGRLASASARRPAPGVERARFERGDSVDRPCRTPGQVRPALLMHPPARRRYAGGDDSRLGWRFCPKRGTTTQQHPIPRHHRGRRAAPHKGMADQSTPLHATACAAVSLGFRARKKGANVRTDVGDRDLPERAGPAFGCGHVGASHSISDTRGYRSVIARQVAVGRLRGRAQRYVRVLRGSASGAGVYDAWFRERAESTRLARDSAGELAQLPYRPRIWNRHSGLQHTASCCAPWSTGAGIRLAAVPGRRCVERSRRRKWRSTPSTAATRASVSSAQPVNGGISSASNAALALADGGFVALLDGQRRDRAGCTARSRGGLNRHPDADVVYTDEDKLDFDGTHIEPFLQPYRVLESNEMFLGHLHHIEAVGVPFGIRRFAGLRISCCG